MATADLGSLVRGLRLEVTEAQLERLVNEVDPEGTGEIERADVEALIGQNPLPFTPPAEEIARMFAPFDRQKDGHVDAAELVEAMRSRGEPLSEEDVENLVREMAIDGDKRISIAAFVQHMYATSQ